VHHAAVRKLPDFGNDSRSACRTSAVFERPPHQLSVVNRSSIIAEGNRPRLDQLPDLGQFLPFAFLLTQATTNTLQLSASRRLMPYELDVACVSIGGSVLGMQAPT